MSRYHVEWLPDAEDELADLWLQAGDRKAITAAEAAITRLLGTDPLTNGEELSEGLRKLTVWPLVVFYAVESARDRVEVSNVKRLPP